MTEETSNPTNDQDKLHAEVIDSLRLVYDPEIPVNIYDLGLIYDVQINDKAEVFIKMTLTSPTCPVAQTFPGTVEAEVRSIPDVKNAFVELVWDPPWTKEMMTEDAKLMLGMFD